jgi:tRNA-splicing ligase RtcB
MVRTYQEELEYLERINPFTWRIKKGFVPNMKVIGEEIKFQLKNNLEEIRLKECFMLMNI